MPETAKPEAPQKERQGGVNLKANDAAEFLGVNLRGLAFFDRPSQISADGLAIENDERDSDTLLISAVPVETLQSSEFADRLKSYTNIPLTLNVLRELQEEVINYYKSIGRSYVAVSVPPQDISSGVVQVVVIEARVGKISVDGNKWFEEEQYKDTLRLKTDDEIDLNRLDEDIAWVNRNPFRNADIVTEAGEQYGTTDVTILTNERFPLRVYAEYDNYGTDISGKDRILAGFNWGNAFWQGHELNYQYSRSTDGNLSRGHSGSYIIPLRWRHILGISAAYSKNNPDIAQPFDSEGKSWSLDMTYTIPLKSHGNYSHQFSIKVPFKSSDNTLEFSQTPITDNETHILHAELSYSGSWQQEGSYLGFNLGFIGSPGGLTGRNEDQFFNTSRAGATADYGIFRAGVSFSKTLPKDFSWTTNLSAQTATGNLVGIEQFALAGVGAVRGYDNGMIYRDRGFVVRNELRAPNLYPLQKFTRGNNLPNGTLRLYAFLDVGVGSNVDLLPGEDDSATLASIGLGMRFALGALLSINLDYGWQLSDDHVSIRDTSSQLHASVTIGY